MKATSYMNKTMIDKQSSIQSIKYYGTLRRYTWSMPWWHNFFRILCDAAEMSRGCALISNAC